MSLHIVSLQIENKRLWVNAVLAHEPDPAPNGAGQVHQPDQQQAQPVTQEEQMEADFILALEDSLAKLAVCVNPPLRSANSVRFGTCACQHNSAKMHHQTGQNDIHMPMMLLILLVTLHAPK